MTPETQNAPNEKNEYGETPLHLAAFSGRADVARILLAEGAEYPRDVDLKGRSPLHDAANPEVAELLIAAGANPAARDLDGRSPLHAAAEYGRTDVARILLAQGADPNAADHKGRSPLHEIAHDDIENALVARLLVAAGADPDAKNRDGRTPADLTGNPALKAMLAAAREAKELAAVAAPDAAENPAKTEGRRRGP